MFTTKWLTRIPVVDGVCRNAISSRSAIVYTGRYYSSSPCCNSTVHLHMKHTHTQKSNSENSNNSNNSNNVNNIKEFKSTTPPIMVSSTTTIPPIPTTPIPPPASIPPQQGTNKPSFYQRPLPSHLIAFSSEQGRQLFREALQDGNMEGYFTLAEQFVSQSDPAYCGLATLAMVLNSLKIDPKRLWKGPWRWFAEDMLDCCTPIESVKKRGITFTEFACLSRCNGSKLTPYRGDETTLDHFRQSIIDACSKQSLHLVISYSRKVLGQTGSGHYSPIGGYHKGKDLALVLDVARFKYSPHWVPVTTLWESMLAIDPETNKPRGYYLMTNDPTYQPSFCRVKNSLSWASIADKFLKSLPNLIQNSNIQSVDHVIKTVFNNLPNETTHVLCAYSHELYKRKSEEVGSQLSWSQFFDELSKTNAYRKLNELIGSGEINWTIKHDHQSTTPSTTSTTNQICHEYPIGLATILFLSLPAQIFNSLGHSIRDEISLARNLDELNVEVIDEVFKIRQEMFQVTQNPCLCSNGSSDQKSCDLGNNNNNTPNIDQSNKKEERNYN